MKQIGRKIYRKNLTTMGLLSLVFLLLAHPPLFAANEITASDIIKRAYNVDRVDDQFSTLTITIKKANNPDKKLAFKMAWKNTKGKDGYQEKVLLVGEFPPDQAGIVYMSFRRGPNASKEDDTWLYLPELRTVRRISQRDHKHEHDDVFGNSALKRMHLEQRDPSNDSHELLRVDTLEDREYYVIESTLPKQAMPMKMDMPEHYIKYDSWIDKKTFTTRRIEFYGANKQPDVVMNLTWVKMDNTWIWKKVIGKDRTTGNVTLFQISDIKVNTGINSRLFTKRTMKRGVRGLR